MNFNEWRETYFRVWPKRRAEDERQSAPTSDSYVEREAQAIRMLGARGVISQEDAERIAREHIERRNRGRDV